MTTVVAPRTLELTLDRAPRARDPNLMTESGKAPNPSAAPLTTDPNRYTIRVPSFATKLSLGQGDALETATRNKRVGVGTESGIVGQTDLHTHFHTFGTLVDQAKTLVRLGIPPTSVPPTAAYAPNAETGIGALNFEAYAKWPGYSMVTQGGAYQESRYNHLVISAEGEVRAVAKTRIALGTSGDVIIGADTAVLPKFLAANESEPESTAGKGNPDPHFRTEKITAGAVEGAKLAEELVKLLTAAIYGSPEGPMPLLAMWRPPDWMTTLKTAAEWILFAAELGTYAATLALPESEGGKIGAYASDTITMTAENGMAFNTPAVITMNAGRSVKINGGISASMTGLVSASMSGVLTSISGLYSATVESLFSHVEVRSPVGVNLFSGLGPVCVTASTSAQLNSVLGGAYVHGLLNSYIGAGPEGAGMGVVNFPAAMSIGNLLSPGTFDTPAPDPTRGITILPALMSFTMVPSSIDVTPAAVEVETPVFDVTAESGAMITAPVIMLSGMVYLG